MAARHRPTRRTFITSAGAVAAAVWATGPAILRAQTGDKLRLADDRRRRPRRRQPEGRRGREHRRPLRRGPQTPSTRRPPRIPQARKEVDFRRLFDQPGEFDAVVVSTSEHTHAFATLPALQLGKHVYCEKPLTHNVCEARIIREAAAKAGVATQMGTQIHAGDNYRRVVELVQAGAIGRVTRVPRLGGARLGLARQRGRGHRSQGHRLRAGPPGDRRSRSGRPRLGPLARARARAAVQHVYLPGPKWYRWWDFGNGTMSDLGSHWNDLPFWALKLQRAAHDRGQRAAAARRDRPGVDAGDL